MMTLKFELANRYQAAAAVDSLVQWGQKQQ
jgi:hypothetical protein